MVKYKALEKGRPGVVGGGDKLYYASIVRNEKVPLRVMVEECSELNTLNTADVLATLESFLQICSRHLLKGSAIDLGQLGTFSPTIHSQGEERAEDVSSSSIKKFAVNFRPSVLLTDRLASAKFKKVSSEPSVDEVK